MPSWAGPSRYSCRTRSAYRGAAARPIAAKATSRETATAGRSRFWRVDGGHLDGAAAGRPLPSTATRGRGPTRDAARDAPRGPRRRARTPSGRSGDGPHRALTLGRPRGAEAVDLGGEPPRDPVGLGLRDVDARPREHRAPDDAHRLVLDGEDRSVRHPRRPEPAEDHRPRGPSRRSPSASRAVTKSSLRRWWASSSRPWTAPWPNRTSATTRGAAPRRRRERTSVNTQDPGGASDEEGRGPEEPGGHGGVEGGGPGAGRLAAPAARSRSRGAAWR